MKNQWTKTQLKASVEAYLDMQRKEILGTKFIKRHYYQELSEKFGLSKKSYEYRFQNISYVLSLMGRQWITGLKPAKNVGTNKIIEIEQLINEVEGSLSPTHSEAVFQDTVSKVYKSSITQKPTGKRKPIKNASTTTHYNRDPKVVAWILHNANNCCEQCESKAPFNREDGTPYLEVHHVTQLADGGPDTIENAVALCPNCHRELHFGLDKKSLKNLLYQRIRRLPNV